MIVKHLAAILIVTCNVVAIIDNYQLSYVEEIESIYRINTFNSNNSYTSNSNNFPVNHCISDNFRFRKQLIIPC